jgi:mRNA-degrading endonuclease toxin of MazEF toxin-antitoxin module
MLRHSNNVFTKGSIVFAKFDSSSNEAYLNNRPLIIVSNPTHILKTVVVCTTGTQDKPGIILSLYNHRERKYIGGAETSKIFPYNLRTIYTDQIESCIGQLDPFIMREVDNCIDFHFGRSDKVPGYLKEYEDYIIGVQYNPIKEFYVTDEKVSDNIKHQYELPKEVHTAPATENSKMTKPVTKHNSTIIDNEYIMHWVGTKPKDNVDLLKIYNDSAALMSVLDEESISMIVSRVVPIALVKCKYGVNHKTASLARITLTNYMIKDGLRILNNSRYYRDTAIDSLPDHAVIGMILAKAFSARNIKVDKTSLTKFNAVIDRVKTKYSININDKRIWRNVASYNSRF